MYEFLGHNQKIIKIKENVNETNARDAILDHIVMNIENKNTDFKYENDITIFSEIEDEELADLNSNSESFCVIFTVFVLFVINFLIVNPSDNFFQFNQSISNFFESDPNGTDLLTDTNLRNFTNIKNYFNDTVLKRAYDYEGNTYNQEIKRFQNQGNPDDNNTTKNISQINLTVNNYYPLSNNYFCGILVNFKRANSKNLNFSFTK